MVRVGVGSFTAAGYPALVALALLSACAPEVVEGLDCAPRNTRAPGAPPVIDLTVLDEARSEMAWGHLLMNQSDGDESWVTVMNGCGEHTWSRPNTVDETRIYRAHLSEDARSVFFAEHNREHRPDMGMLYELDIASDTVVSTTRMPEAHHDFAVLPDASVAWISWQYLQNEWFGSLEEDVVSDAVRTAELGTPHETDDRLFSLYDTLRLEPWWTCSHMNPTSQIPGYAEWSHSNSLMYEPVEDRLYLYVRYWDALVAFDRTGRYRWMMGGPLNDFELVGDTELPVHAHMSEVWPGGALIFDNRNHDERDASRVVELAWDEASGTVEEVWSYEDGTFAGFLGDARRLPGGNVLIVWSSEGRMTEVTREGDVVWEATVDGRFARVEFHPEWPPE